MKKLLGVLVVILSTFFVFNFVACNYSSPNDTYIYTSLYIDAHSNESGYFVANFEDENFGGDFTYSADVGDDFILFCFVWKNNGVNCVLGVFIYDYKLPKITVIYTESANSAELSCGINYKSLLNVNGGAIEYVKYNDTTLTESNINYDYMTNTLRTYLGYSLRWMTALVRVATNNNSLFVFDLYN